MVNAGQLKSKHKITIAFALALAIAGFSISSGRYTIPLTVALLCLTYVIVRNAYMPLQRLDDFVLSFSNGRLAERQNGTHSDEVGQVLTTFNTVLDRLQESTDELMAQNKELDHLLFGAVEALAMTIEAKDPYTKGHSKRVMEYSALIGEHLHFPKRQINLLCMAALMHDVGKIGVSEDIIRKPGKLTEVEYEEMKRHSEIARSILSPISSLSEIVPYIYHLHERYDGKGYPGKLSSAEIPVESRILSVADAFDTITSDRPYRKGSSISRAIEELKKCAGTQFDPEIVDLFARALSPQVLGVVSHPAS